jgi:hypothetical protein
MHESTDVDPTASTSNDLARRWYWLFENDFVDLSCSAVSCGTEAGFDYIDHRTVLTVLLPHRGGRSTPEGSDREQRALHETAYRTGHTQLSVISGRPLDVVAIVKLNQSSARPTEPMRKRGIANIEGHMYTESDLQDDALTATLERARSLCRDRGMRHTLLLDTSGLLLVEAPTLAEAMIHFQNVVVSMRIEATRLQLSEPSDSSLKYPPNC